MTNNNKLIQVLNDEAFLESVQGKADNDVKAAFADRGITDDDFAAFGESMSKSELSAEDLDNVTGGIAIPILWKSVQTGSAIGRRLAWAIDKMFPNAGPAVAEAMLKNDTIYKVCEWLVKKGF